MGAEKKPADGGGDKKDDGKSLEVAVSVLKMDMHCKGCAKKIKHVVKRMDGVEDAKVDTAGNKLTVTGKVDDAKIKATLEENNPNRKVDIVTQPKNDGGDGGDTKGFEKYDKVEEKKPPKESAVVLEKRLDSDDCISDIEKFISKTKGVPNVVVDKPKGLVTVTRTGTETMDVNLKEKKVEEKKPPKEIAVVLKTRLDLDGCISEIEEIIGKSKGVPNVVLDEVEQLVTVTGTMDVKELMRYLKEKKIKEKKPPKESTVVLKTGLDCDGSISEIGEIIEKSKGVPNVVLDKAEELVTVTGTMDVKELMHYLKEIKVEEKKPPKEENKKKVDKAKELVAVTGTMDVQELMWRYFPDVVPTKKERNIYILGDVNIKIGN